MLRTGLDMHFEVVMTSSGLGAGKPSPAAFHRACARLQADAATVMYVGDSIDVDAQAATAAGLVGVWLDRHVCSDPCYQPTIATLEELPRLVD